VEPTRIGINGLGRIGRCALRAAWERPDVEVVAANDLVDPGDMAYLVAHDSVHGRFPTAVAAADGALVLGDRTIPFHAERDPASIPWGDLGVDVVIESTGAFRSRADAAGHLDAGASTVLISAPSDDADVTIVPGVNDAELDTDRHGVISMASCTTNCVAPVLLALHRRFGVERGTFTTIHAYTSSQGLVDGPSRKRRRGRAAALSMVPTTTGAAVATERVLPSLEGRLDGLAVRVPVPDGSLVDLVATLDNDVAVEDLVECFREAAAGDLAGVLGVSDDELVSIDIVGRPESALVDVATLGVLGGRTVKVLAWYDNEMGYATRLVDLATMVHAA
jgi:glyceraldehyde 3-phosphate dehydrogenase